MNYQDWAASYSKQPVLAVLPSIRRASDGLDVPLHLATDDSQIWDGVNYYTPGVRGIPKITRGTTGQDGGRGYPAYGNVEIAIEPGATLDVDRSLTWDAVLAGGWIFGGLPIQVLKGGPGLPWGSWREVITGRQDEPTIDDKRLVLPANSRAEEVVGEQLPPNEYGDEVPEASQGKAIPLCWGPCRNIEPVLIGESPWVYQFNDPARGPVQAVDVVRRKGLAIAAGFTVDLDQATVSFASEPQGNITLDVRGMAPAGGYINLPGQIIRDILTRFRGVAAGELAAAAFTALDLALPWPVNLYLTSKQDVSAIFDSLLTGLLADWGTTRAGLWTVRRQELPAGDPVLVLEDSDLLDFTWKPETRLYWKATLAGDRNYTPSGSVDDAVAQADLQWLKEQWRERSASDEAIKALYPRAEETPTHQTHVSQLEHLALAAAGFLSRFGQGRRYMTATIKDVGLLVERGDPVLVCRNRFGLQAGRLGTVERITEDHMRNRITLELFH